jgi:hypothetical protein
VLAKSISLYANEWIRAAIDLKRLVLLQDEWKRRPTCNRFRDQCRNLSTSDFALEFRSIEEERRDYFLQSELMLAGLGCGLS